MISNQLAVIRRTVVCALAIMTLLLAALPATAAPEDDYNLAVGLYQKQRWDETSQSFRTFLKSNPNHSRAATARLYLGLALVNQGDFAAARDALREFVKLHPDDKNLPDALYRIGETSYSLEDYQQAEKDLLAFLTRYPRHTLGEWALPYLADAELRLGKPAQAAGHFQQAIDQYPQGKLTNEARFGLARALEAEKKIPEAVKLYRELAASDGPRAAASQLRVATILYDEQDYAKAAVEFLALTERFPKSPLLPTAQLNTGFAFYRVGDYEQAATALQAASEHPSQSATALHWLGMARKAQGDSAAAAKAFKQVVESSPNQPIASESRFQWADAELRSGNYEEAMRLFEAIVTADPRGPQAADSLYFAGEAALLAGKLDEAAAFAGRFKQDFGRAAYRMHNQLLSGRIAEARATREEVAPAERDALEKQALADYQAVLDETTIDATAAKARFQIARLQERRNEPKESLEAIQPLLDGIAAEGADSPYLDALIIAARDYLALDDPKNAIEQVTKYLQLAPQGSQADAALAARAVAYLEFEDTTSAKADWKELTDRFPQSSLLIPTSRDLAERAYDKQDWSNAADFFQGLSDVAAGQPQQAIGLSGVGWSLHKAGKYQEAAAAFDTLLKQFPDTEQLAPEAAYMKGKSLQDANDLAAAADAYRVAFERFAPKEPAATGDEASGPLRNAYLAGLQLARDLRLQGKTAEADAAYVALLDKFPKPHNLDELLEEWALLHYEAEDYEKADSIFRRIVAESPDSPAAANARLSLAESALFAGQLAEAKSSLEEISNNAKIPEQVRQRALSLLVSLAAERGDWKSAETLARNFVSKHPDGRERPIVLYQLGEALLQQGELEQAKSQLSQVEALADQSAVSSESWFPRVYVLLGEISFQQKDYAAAHESLDKLAALEPKPAYAYLADELRGRIYKNQVKFDEARAAFQRVLDDPNARRTSTAARAQYELAQTYFLQERWNEARTEAFKVYTLYKFPEWQAPALLMAGLSDEALGERDKARSAFADVVKEFPDTKYATQARQKLQRLGNSKG